MKYMLQRKFLLRWESNDVTKSFDVIANHSGVYDDLSFENVANIAEELMNHFTNGNYDRIGLFAISLKTLHK